jgi:hypothetical protein
MIARGIVLIVAIIICTTVGRATVVDLTGSNDSGTINGAEFVFTTPQPTGTGVIQPFLRLENSPVEQGYNTSGGTPFDDKAGPWTHDLTFGDLQNPQVTLGGGSYFKLLLDVNEPGGSKSLISLDQLQFYTSKVGSQTTSNVARSELCATPLAPVTASSSMLHVITAAAPAICMHISRRPILPAPRRATSSIYMRTSVIPIIAKLGSKSGRW